MANRRSSIRRQDIVAFLPDIQAVAHGEPPRAVKWIVVAMAAGIAALLAWAIVAEVDEIATAPGVVRPAGRTKIVNHVEGGTVARLLVRDGQEVKAGQELAHLDPRLIEREIENVTERLHTRIAEVNRLEGEAAGEEPRFAAELVRQFPQIVDVQRRLYDSRKASLLAQRNGADRTVESRTAEFDQLERRVPSLESSVKLLADQEKAIAELVEKGHYPKLRHITVQRQLVEVQGQLAEAREQVRGARAALDRAREERRRIDEQWRAETLDALARAATERQALAAALEQLKTRHANLVIRSPVDGVVEELVVRNEGQVVRASDAILKIVPTSANLVIEAKVSNRDIGHIRIGHEATVKVRTYDFTRYGTLRAKVVRISTDAEASREGERRADDFTFAIVVETERNFLGVAAGEYPVRPGMSVDVDVHIGRRAVISYFTDRVVRTTSSAFRER
jgi:adhesin transport system membrane fusion protein